MKSFHFPPTQCDLKQRQVNQWEIETLCREHSFIGWTETSAKDDLMVGDCMRLVFMRKIDSQWPHHLMSIEY